MTLVSNENREPAGAGDRDPVKTAAAISAAMTAALRRQQAGGSWLVGCHAGPATTAHVTVALRFMGKLDDGEARATGRWLEQQWLGPGRGFEIYPGAGTGDLGATAAVLAALHACGYPREQPVMRDARQLIEQQGGEAGLLQRLRQGDLAAVFLAMVGLFPANRLPPAPPALFLPGVERAIESRLNVILPFTLQVTEAIVKFLRTGRRPLAEERRWWGGRLAEVAADVAGKLEARRALAHFRRFHNADGSWLYGDTYHASLVLAAMFALGVRDDDPDFAAGLEFLASKRRGQHPGRPGAADQGHPPGSEAGTRCYPIFDTDVWPTAFMLRSLLEAGLPPGDPAVVRAVDWLCACQRQGAWAFQERNTSMPDGDDVGVTIAALAMAVDPRRSPPLPPAPQARARAAVQHGRQWLFGRQNREGGWAAFQVGLPGKGRGPIMTAPPSPPGEDLWSHLSLLRDAPPEIGDPAIEDLTGRVLFGLGRSGSTVAEREVARAVAFLQNLQDTNGGWWGRWTINYLAGTAWVLRGLAAVGIDRQAPWVRRGLRFLIDHQNADGGWGESPASYSDLDQIGRGPSTPGLTGLVLAALVEMGMGPGDPAVVAARRHLLEAQRPDGTWPASGELHALLPPRLFYDLPETENQLPLEALGICARVHDGQAVEVTDASVNVADATVAHLGAGSGTAGRWSVPLLQRMRGEGDPLADAVVGLLIEAGQLKQVNALFRMLMHSGDPLPPELPAVAGDYFRSQAQLPSWTEPLKLELAQALFQRCGFAVATALFCSSLPQCFAFPDGARVLAATARFEDSARRRVLETAQFIFDVAAPGGLSPDGRGIRAAQKVRLMHAAVRRHLQQRGWDQARDGLPINQQQLAGTTLTFSLVVTDALRAMGFEVRDDEAEAWFHLWRVVGLLTGIDPAYLPANLADGRLLMAILRDRFWGPSPEGAAQARATLAVMQETLPGRQWRGLPAALVRHLAGDRCADLLELPRADWTRRVVEGGAFLLETAVPRKLGRSALAATAQQASFALMRALGELNTGNDPVTFQVPADLRQRWRPGA